MSTTATVEHAEGHDHPSDAVYWKVAGFLGALTALEVSTYWWPESGFTTAALLILMVIKFVYVAMFFMHLKFDSKVLTMSFVTGLIVAGCVYVAALGSMHWFTDDSGKTTLVNPPRAKLKPPPPTELPPIITGSSGH